MNTKPTFEELPEVVALLTDEIRTLQRQIKSTSGEANKNKEDFLSVHQAAEFLRISIPTVYSKVSKGELPYMKRGNRLYFSSTELTDYLKAGRRPTNKEIDDQVDQYLTPKK